MRYFLHHRIADLLKKYAAEEEDRKEEISTPVARAEEAKPAKPPEEGEKKTEQPKAEATAGGQATAGTAEKPAAEVRPADQRSETPQLQFRDSSQRSREAGGKEQGQEEPLQWMPPERQPLVFDTKPAEEFIIESGQKLSEIFPGLAYRINIELGNIPDYVLSLMFPLHAEALKNILPEIGSYYEARDRLHTLPANDRRTVLAVMNSTYGKVRNQFHRIIEDMSLRLREINTFDHAVRSLGLIGARKYLGDQGLNFYPMFLSWRQAQYNLAIKDALDRGLPVNEQPIPFANRVNGINAGSFFDQAAASFSTVATLLRQDFTPYEKEGRLHQLLTPARLGEFALALNWLTQNDPFFTINMVFTEKELSNFKAILSYAQQVDPGIYNQLVMAVKASDKKHAEFVDALEDAINTVRTATVLTDEQWKDPETRNKVIEALNLIGATDPTMLSHVDPKNRGFVGQILSKLGNDIERVNPIVRFGHEPIVEAIKETQYRPVAGIFYDEQNMNALMQNIDKAVKDLINQFNTVVTAISDALKVSSPTDMGRINQIIIDLNVEANFLKDVAFQDTISTDAIINSFDRIIALSNDLLSIASAYGDTYSETGRRLIQEFKKGVQNAIQNFLMQTRNIRVETEDNRLVSLFTSIEETLNKIQPAEGQSGDSMREVISIVKNTPTTFQPPGVQEGRSVAQQEQPIQRAEPTQVPQPQQTQATQQTKQEPAGQQAAETRPAAQMQPAVQTQPAQAVLGVQGALPQEQVIPTSATSAAPPAGQQVAPQPTGGQQGQAPVLGATPTATQPVFPAYTYLGRPTGTQNLRSGLGSLASAISQPPPDAFRTGKRMNKAYIDVVTGPYYSRSGRYSDINLLPRINLLPPSQRQNQQRQQQ